MILEDMILIKNQLIDQLESIPWCFLPLIKEKYSYLIELKLFLELKKNECSTNLLDAYFLKVKYKQSHACKHQNNFFSSQLLHSQIEK